MAEIDFRIPAILELITKEDERGVKRRFFHTTASSTFEDSHGDEFTERAVEKMASQARGSGMSIFLNHEYRIPEDLFGTTTDAIAVNRAAGGAVVKDLDLIGFINEANPRARETAEALDGGAKLGVSIGARIKDYRPRDDKDPLGGWIIDDVELKEASIVGMPANPRTWVHYATKAINAFERERVKEAVMKDKHASVVAQLPVDESITEDGTELLALMDQADAFPADGALDTPEFEDGVLDLGEETDEVETAEVEVSEEPAQVADEPAESPDEKNASETPEHVLSQALDASVDAISVDVLKSALQVATEEITKRDETIDQLTEERDAALATLSTATAIVERIASTPLGRKARFQAEVTDYRSRIGGVYDEEFVKFLKGSNTQ